MSAVLDRSVYFFWGGGGGDHLCILYDGSCEHFNLSHYHNIMEIKMNQIFYEVTAW